MTLRGVHWGSLRGVIPLLLLLLLAQLSAGVQVFSYHHLGCHKDDPTARDLNGIGYSLAVVQLDNCATKCRNSGYPYVGLQNGQQCYCGMTYGKHGTTDAYRCNNTCDGLKCGGYQTNSIYYTVRKDAASMQARVYEAHPEPLTFVEARQVCVKYDGDLSPITSQKELSDVIAVADGSMADSNKFWFGLRKVSQKFTWTDTALNYDATAVQSFWDSSETFQLSCVVVDNRTDKWETSSCSGSYPFVCLQKPTPPTEAPTTAGTDTGAADEDSGISNQAKITMYVIIPIFFFCYGGSCLLYAISKCYKALRRRRRQKEQQAHLTEFEPDTKPFSLGGRSTPIHPVTSRDIDLTDGGPPPQPRLAEPVPPYRKDKVPERPVHTPVMAFNPEPQNARPLSRAKTPQEIQAEKKIEREDQRRNRLLQNALIEARERRRTETPCPERPGSDSSNEFPRPPTGPTRKRKSPHHGREGSDGSADSMSMLLPKEQPKPDQGSVIDFTKLSIQDIIIIKQMMGQAKKTKPKKILTA